MSELEVRHGSTEVGRLAATPLHLRFTYARGWLTSQQRFPISVTIPLREEPYDGGPANTFFGNLLPEGMVRRAVCARLGISEANDFALLTAIGGECAGALSLVAPGTPPPDPEAYRYEQLKPAQLQTLISDPAKAPLLLGGPEVRLSLAGAQEKLPVALIDGAVCLPSHQAPSTHILKLPHGRYKHLLINEAYVLGLATRIGFEVERAQLYTKTRPSSLLVERYDRRPADGDDWPVVRLHQEDLCQALGYPSATKYEIEGGPPFPRIVALLQQGSSRPLVDVKRVIEWQAFNIVVGNSDGHAKNLSLLYDGATSRLAPFYDLLSTRLYPDLAFRLALRVGDRDHPDEVGLAQWRQLADAIGVSGKLVVELVENVIERCIDELPAWTAEFESTRDAASILQTLPGAIRKRAKQLRRRLHAGRA